MNLVDIDGNDEVRLCCTFSAFHTEHTFNMHTCMYVPDYTSFRVTYHHAQVIPIGYRLCRTESAEAYSIFIDTLLNIEFKTAFRMERARDIGTQSQSQGHCDFFGPCQRFVKECPRKTAACTPSTVVRSVSPCFEMLCTVHNY